MKRIAPASIDAYISRFPDDVQKRLQKIRATIRKAAPDAEEVISYQIPAFKLNGIVVYFAAFQNHISLYPAPRGSEQFKDELSVYAGGKGTIQFPADKPVPYDLITRIVKFRVQQNLEKAESKRRKR